MSVLSIAVATFNVCEFVDTLRCEKITERNNHILPSSGLSLNCSSDVIVELLSIC